MHPTLYSRSICRQWDKKAVDLLVAAGCYGVDSAVCKKPAPFKKFKGCSPTNTAEPRDRIVFASSTTAPQLGTMGPCLASNISEELYCRYTGSRGASSSFKLVVVGVWPRPLFPPPDPPLAMAASSAGFPGFERLKSLCVCQKHTHRKIGWSCLLNQSYRDCILTLASPAFHFLQTRNPHEARKQLFAMSEPALFAAAVAAGNAAEVQAALDKADDVRPLLDAKVKNDPLLFGLIRGAPRGEPAPSDAAAAAKREVGYPEAHRNVPHQGWRRCCRCMHGVLVGGREGAAGG